MTSVSSSVKLACSRFRKQSRVSAEGSWQLLNLITSVTCSRKRAARQKLFVHALHSNPTSRPRSKHRQTPAASPLFWHHSLSISKMTKFTDKAGDRSAQQEAGRAQLSPSVYRLPWPSPHSRMAEAAARRGKKKSQTPQLPVHARAPACHPRTKRSNPWACPPPLSSPFPGPQGPIAPRRLERILSMFDMISRVRGARRGGGGSTTGDRDGAGGESRGRAEAGAAPGFWGSEPTSCFGSGSRGGWSPASHRGGSGTTPKWLQ